MGRVSNPETTRLLGIAFEFAIQALHNWGVTDPPHEAIARAIIGFARAGERDPERPCDLAVEGVRRTGRPQSSSASRCTAGAAGFLNQGAFGLNAFIAIDPAAGGATFSRLGQDGGPRFGGQIWTERGLCRKPTQQPRYRAADPGPPASAGEMLTIPSRAHSLRAEFPRCLCRRA